MEQFKIYNIDMIKMHGSGTEQNTTAEDEAINELFGNIDRIEYKSKIGHSQGVSAVVEICKLMDEYQNKSVLVNASGLGNFYGSCYVRL
jgi:3-oxoacyl-(acyl-carrier-protein) synthase